MNIIISLLGLTIILLSVINSIKERDLIPFFLALSIVLFEFNDLILIDIGYKVLLFVFILFIPVFISYLKTGLVLKFPTLIVSGVLLTLSLIFFITGLILDSIKTKFNQIAEILNNK